MLVVRCFCLCLDQVDLVFDILIILLFIQLKFGISMAWCSSWQTHKLQGYGVGGWEPPFFLFI